MLKSLDEQIISSLLMDSEILDWTKRHIHEIKDRELEENKIMVNAQNSRTSDLGSRKLRLRELVIRGTLTDEEYKTEMSKIQEEIAIPQEKISDWFEHLNEILNLGQAWKTIFEKGDVKLKKEAIIKLGPNLTWDEEKLIITNEEWMNQFLNATKLAKQEFEKSEPKISPYVTRVKKEKEVQNVPLHPALLANSS